MIITLNVNLKTRLKLIGDKFLDIPNNQFKSLPLYPLYSGWEVKNRKSELARIDVPFDFNNNRQTISFALPDEEKNSANYIKYANLTIKGVMELDLTNYLDQDLLVNIINQDVKKLALKSTGVVVFDDMNGDLSADNYNNESLIIFKNTGGFVKVPITFG